MKEIWKDIPHYEGKYLISNSGKVKSFKHKKPILLKQYIGTHGYCAVGLWRNKQQNQVLIHRLIADVFLDNPHNKDQVNHKDGNKINNHVSNLEWCSCKENTQHAWKNGFCASIKQQMCSRIGEKNSSSKITQQQVAEIRNKYIPYQYSQYKLAKEYHLAQATIWAIINRQTWKC